MTRKELIVVLLLTPALWGRGVVVRFEPATPDVGPFPSDALTVADPLQKTGRRVNMPLPDCGTYVSACQDLATVNAYDGFSLFPRLRVRFSGPVDVNTLREGIFLIALENVTQEEFGLSPAGKVVPINQLILDPETQTVYAKPDTVLDQHRRFALVVTDAVRDRAGDVVDPDPAFLSCIDRPSDSYCDELSRWVRPLSELFQRFGATRRVVAASIFTTLSATAWLEKVRDVLPGVSPAFRRIAPKNLFAVSDLAGILYHQQIRTNPPAFQDVPVRTDLLAGIGRIAFGSYRSPNFLNAKHLIANVPTGTPLELPAASSELFFQVFLPSLPKPPSGYPVVIAGHGRGSSRMAFPFLGIAQSMAAAGYATVAITAVGHGFGPEGTVIVRENNGSVTEMAAGGRGVDLDGDATIGAFEGCYSPQGPTTYRDCFRQTTVDLMQLVRAIRGGMDLDGDGTSDLDAGRIQFIGISLGAMYGTVLSAVEPGILAAVLSVGSGGVDWMRWSPVFRPELADMLSSRTPPVMPNAGGEFNDNYVLRYQPVKINDVPGAIEIQNIYEMLEWIQMPGDPLAYAPHLRSSTLAGVPLKRALLHMARGDQSSPNPTGTMWVAAANMRDWTVLYRADLARVAAPDLPINPHGFLTTLAPASAMAIALAAQQQAARFFSESAGCRLDEPCVPDVNDLLRPLFGRDLFEIPEVLPADLGFLAP